MGRSPWAVRVLGRLALLCQVGCHVPRLRGHVLRIRRAYTRFPSPRTAIRGTGSMPWVSPSGTRSHGPPPVGLGDRCAAQNSHMPTQAWRMAPTITEAEKLVVCPSPRTAIRGTRSMLWPSLPGIQSHGTPPVGLGDRCAAQNSHMPTQAWRMARGNHESRKAPTDDAGRLERSSAPTRPPAAAPRSTARERRSHHPSMAVGCRHCRKA